LPAGASATAGGAATVGPFGTAEDLAVLDTVSVAGDDPAKAPTATLAKMPVSVTATTRKVLTSGTGMASESTSAVTANLTLFRGSDGKLLDTSYGGAALSPFQLDDGVTIVGLVKGLTGVQAGSRVLIVIPPADAFGTKGYEQLGVAATDNLVLVADIVKVTAPPPVLKQAQGTDVAPVAGLPTVTFDATAGPTITIPAGVAAPTDLVVQPLVDGTGDVVASGQTITVHYTGALWKDGKVFDSSWTRGKPASFAIGTGKVIPGWDKGLVGKKVGSRMLLVIPPADGYGTAGQSNAGISGTDTLVFVVDILGAS
jgi:peptidylprolyl isomerase